MNPITDQPPPAPALPLQPPRSSFSCDNHPDENFTGFCPSCLCERLTVLDQSAAAASSSRRNSTSSATVAAAVKSIFRVPSSTTEPSRNKITTATTRASFLPELRRTKSFSASKNEGLGFTTGAFEPQRKSCDVRGRNTLWSLFSIDDDNNPRRSSSAQQQTLGGTGTVLETNKEDDENGDEIRVSEEENDLEKDIVEMEAEIDAIVDNFKTMKDHIDLDAASKKPSRSNFWSAASVLTKKWQKWRRKQKNSNDVASSFTLPLEKKPISRQCRETCWCGNVESRAISGQSRALFFTEHTEIADYGFGRRSCDVDPRFSLDAGRVSFDDPRYSFDEPRASWDGYFNGRTLPRLPPMAEVVSRSDMQIPVEEPANVPGGSTQTRQYYLDSSSKRRKSLDRSNSMKMDAKVSPATIDYSHSNGRLKFRSIGGERELTRDSNSNSLRDNYCSETIINKRTKKSRWWSLNLWGFMQRHGENKEEGNRKVCRSNSSVSWRNSSYGSVKNNNNDDFVLQRNQSMNNGLLRFYLTPLRGSRRGSIGIRTGKSKLSSNSHSIARNMLPLY